MKIYVIGLLAYETAGTLLKKNRAAIEARFPAFFIREFEQLAAAFAPADPFSEKRSERTGGSRIFLDKFCIEKNTKKPYSNMNYIFDGRWYLREITEGGIFAALWAACEDFGRIRSGQKTPQIIGCRVELEKIPVDQHVVEFLEYLKESPYEVSSKGSWLVIGEADNAGICGTGTDLDLRGWEKKLTEIGRITDQKERVIVYGGTARYLSPPNRQAQDIKDRKRGNRFKKTLSG